jgi:hypothetical protein
LKSHFPSDVLDRSGGNETKSGYTGMVGFGFKALCPNVAIVADQEERPE